MLSKKIRKIYYSIRLLLCGEGYKRAEYIRRHKLFGAMGEHCYFHPWKMPGDPELIFIHNNVQISSDVTFVNHDMSQSLLNTMYNTTKFEFFRAPIEIFDNVMIGTGSIILPGKSIGPNCIVGGGTLVCKNIKEGTVVGGNPVREIGSFADFVDKRRCTKMKEKMLV